MSNKAEQLRHIYGCYDRSIDAPAGIRGRTGDVEDGDTLGSLLRDDSATAEDLLLASEDREARVKFLRQFFALLKQTLFPEEFKFIKLRFTKKKTDKQIAVWLGFKSVSGVFSSIKDKLRAQERTVKRLAARSQWDGAAAFVKAITKSVTELSKDIVILHTKALQESGFEALMRAQEIASEREKKPEEYKIHRRFYMRGFYHGTQIQARTEPLYQEIRLKLHGLIGYIDAMRDYIDVEKPDTEEFYRGMRRDVREYVEELKALIIPTKEAFFETLAEQIIGEDMDGNKSYSERCEERRKRDQALFETVYNQPLIAKSIQRVNEKIEQEKQSLPIPSQSSVSGANVSL